MFSACNMAASSVLSRFLQLLSIVNTKLEGNESVIAVRTGFKHTHYFDGVCDLYIFRKCLGYVHQDAIKKSSP